MEHLFCHLQDKGMLELHILNYMKVKAFSKGVEYSLTIIVIFLISSRCFKEKPSINNVGQFQVTPSGLLLHNICMNPFIKYCWIYTPILLLYHTSVLKAEVYAVAVIARCTVSCFGKNPYHLEHLFKSFPKWRPLKRNGNLHAY